MCINLLPDTEDVLLAGTTWHIYLIFIRYFKETSIPVHNPVQVRYILILSVHIHCTNYESSHEEEEQFPSH